jgi:hypothetical protein
MGDIDAEFKDMCNGIFLEPGTEDFSAHMEEVISRLSPDRLEALNLALSVFMDGYSTGYGTRLMHETSGVLPTDMYRLLANDQANQLIGSVKFQVLAHVMGRLLRGPESDG